MTVLERIHWFKNKLTAATTQVFKNRMIQVDWISRIRLYRMKMVKGVGGIGLIAAITMGGNHYVDANTVEVYHVLVNNQEVGMVNNPQVVDDFKIEKYKNIEDKNPNMHVLLNTDAVTLKSERVFKKEVNNQATLSKLDGMLSPRTVGVQIVIDGKIIGNVKDKDTAEQIFDQIKSKYMTAKIKDASRVGILSASPTTDINPGQSEQQKIDFIQKIELNPIDIQPNTLMNPEDVVTKLQTGDVKPTKYTVEKGDCVSCIAKKFSISKQVIYQNNPWIVDDMLKIGQKIDLTVLQPTLSVQTVEKIVENQEIQFDTDYQKDDSMRLGQQQIIQSGKNGMKKVTFQVTKVNGLMMDEEMVNEEIVIQPTKAIAIKGTKVIVGEGTGKFAWPVLSSSISSGFGYRWGKLHKGVDLTSGNKNILAADNGKVIYAGYTADYGNHIIVNHLNGYKTLYGHLSQLNVVVGKVVEKGEKIGVMGSTGDSTGVHLHFEIQRNDAAENPLKYLNR